MKIVLIGANGQLGTDLKKILEPERLTSLIHQDIEISDFHDVNKKIKELKPEIVINTAAYHKVEDCEKNSVKSFDVNTIGVANLAVTCRDIGAVLAHISTDYVFDGKKGSPYTEDDESHPLNIYGLSKLMGERCINNILPQHFIIRTAGLYGLSKCRAKSGNFIDLMLKLSKEKDEVRVVDDQIISVTYTKDLAQKISELIPTNVYGTYHLTNQGGCSWYEFAKKIFELYELKVNLRRTNSQEFPSSVNRPQYSVLENRNLKKTGLSPLRRWEDALEEYIEERKKHASY